MEDRQSCLSRLFGLNHARIAPFSLSGDANMGNIDAVVADIAEELMRRKVACNAAEVQAPSPASDTAPTTGGSDISIESSVSNADVYVNGKFVGNAPMPGYKLPAGTHVIEVRAAGYQTWKRELSVTAGASSRVMAQLEKSPE